MIYMIYIYMPAPIICAHMYTGISPCRLSGATTTWYPIFKEKSMLHACQACRHGELIFGFTVGICVSLVALYHLQTHGKAPSSQNQLQFGADELYNVSIHARILRSPPPLSFSLSKPMSLITCPAIPPVVW